MVKSTRPHHKVCCREFKSRWLAPQSVFFVPYTMLLLLYIKYYGLQLCFMAYLFLWFISLIAKLSNLVCSPRNNFSAFRESSCFSYSKKEILKRSLLRKPHIKAADSLSRLFIFIFNLIIATSKQQIQL